MTEEEQNPLVTTGSRRSRSSSLVSTSLAAGLIAVLTLSTASSVRAEPATAAAQNPQRKLASLQKRMEQATETYNISRIELKASQKKAAAVRAQMVEQRKKVQVLQLQVDELAASAYRGGNLNEFNSLFSSDGPQNLLDQLSTLQSLSKAQRVQITALSSAQRRLESQRVTVAKEIVVQTKREATLRAKKTAIESDLRRARSLLAAATASRERASRSGARRTQSFPTLPVTGSGRGAVALRFAYAQMGKPYSWGAEGPGSYDCSGLTMRAWQTAGVGLPHSSRMQSQSSPRVARSQLRPGDLVFFGSPVSHVAIFVSGDTAIGAPTTGDVVRYQSISRMGKSYVGATRPG